MFEEALFLVDDAGMPGHVKRGGTGEPDPDPSPFLFISWEDKQKDLAKVKLVLWFKLIIKSKKI